ncbi:MAG: Gmad2 immunoglobulin-like domain-containing protein [Nocardioides sp.]
MNRHEPGQGAGPGSEDDLRRVLHDTVDGLEPQPGLDAIRARTREQHPGHGRAWLLGAFGAAVATAAVVAGVAVLGGGPRPTADNGPAVTPSGQVSPTGDASEEPTDGSSGDATGDTVAAPVYFAGDSPEGVSLYREFQRVDAGDRLRAAANLAVRGSAADPDYRSLWPDGAAIDAVGFDGVGVDGLLQVSLSDAALRVRPPTMTEREAQLAIQQVVYTLQGVVGARAPLQFLLDGHPADTVLGVPTAEPLANEPQLEVLSQVNLTAPEQGEEVASMLVVTGVASSFEATVPLKVMRGSEVVLEDVATADGWGDRLYPFTVSLDLSSLPAGDYTLVASTDDPSGGAEGNGPYTDSKDFTLP